MPATGAPRKHRSHILTLTLTLNPTQTLTVTLTLTPTLLALAPILHPHPHQERLLTFSTSYWLSDLLYLLAAERDPLFLAHHAVCLTIWPGSLG